MCVSEAGLVGLGQAEEGQASKDRGTWCPLPKALAHLQVPGATVLASARAYILGCRGFLGHALGHGPGR